MAIRFFFILVLYILINVPVNIQILKFFTNSFFELTSGGQFIIK
jgi:hypothetical protein